MKNGIKRIERNLSILIFIIIIFISLYFNFKAENQTENTMKNTQNSYEVSNIPEYNGEIYIKINNDIPKFSEEDMSIEEDYYSELKNGRVRNGNSKDKLEEGKCR